VTTLHPSAASAFFPESIRIGAMRNLHLFIEARLRRINGWLADHGGLNPFGFPMYQVVWGWQRPEIYGIEGVGSQLEFFHMERWLPELMSVEEWEWNEAKRHHQLGNKYVRHDYLPHGDWHTILKPCYTPVRTASGEVVQTFRWPDSHTRNGSGLLWYQDALIADRIRLARTKTQIADQVQQHQVVQRDIQRENTQRVSDDNGIRDLIETETQFLLRNPSLRADPDLMLSTVARKKRTKHRVVNTI
jgi:hypothetical protein